jgi:hypothetical protein
MRRYVHLVQLLVDTLLAVTPLALYSQLGILCIPLSSILVLFFRGLFELSKVFLDPFGNAETQQPNDEQPKQSIKTDALISEVNAASTRWWRGAERLPFDSVYVEAERVRVRELERGEARLEIEMGSERSAGTLNGHAAS